VPVLILGNTELVLHHGIVGIIRSLGRMGVPVYCVVKDRLTPAAVSRYLTGAFVWNTSCLNAECFLDGMHTMCKKLGCPAVLIPTDDLSAILIAECAPALESCFLFPNQQPELPRKLANKRELYTLCREIGVTYPGTAFPRSVADVQHFITHAKFPVIVKAAESWIIPKGQRSTTIARDPKQLYAMYEGVESGERGNVLFQEYIPPEYGEDWFYHGYRSARVDQCFGFTGRKLRSYPPLTGPTTLGKAAVNDRLRNQAEQLLKSISYSGIVDLDYRFDKRDDQYKLLDFNPRIGAQFRLFEDTLGTDVVRALYLDLTGQGLPESRPAADRMFIAEFHELAAELGSFFGGLTRPEWGLTLQGKREWAWLSRDDPFPLLMMCIRLLIRVAERGLRVTSRRKPCPNGPRYVTSLRHWFDREALKPISNGHPKEDGN